MKQYLVTPGQLERILHRRALGDMVQDIAAACDVEPVQISRLLHKFMPRMVMVCRRLGVSPPRHGGRRKNSGRPTIPNKKKAKYNINYHAYAKHEPEATITLTCLKCQEEFESTNKVNERICKPCKKSPSWLTGADFSTHHVNQQRYHE